MNENEDKTNVESVVFPPRVVENSLSLEEIEESREELVDKFADRLRKLGVKIDTGGNSGE